jgi:predicted kinase
MLYRLIEDFQKWGPVLVSDMRHCFHNYSAYIINPFHKENDVWSHTCLAYNQLLQLPITDPNLKLLSGISVLCHDVGKVYTRKVDENHNKIKMFNHAFASIQHTIDFIKDLSLLGYFKNIDIDIVYYYVLTAVSNHMDWMYSKDNELIYNKDPNLRILTNILEYCDKTGSICPTNNASQLIKPSSQFIDEKLYPNPDNVLNSDIIFMCGPPASGKDTIVEQRKLNIAKVSFDDIRVQQYKDNNAVDPDWSFHELYKASFHFCNDKKINLNNLMIKQIQEYFNSGYDKVCICNTNLTRKLRRGTINSIKSISSLRDKTIGAMFLCVECGKLHYRDMSRDKSVGVEVINKFCYNQQIPTMKEGIDHIWFMSN